MLPGDVKSPEGDTELRRASGAARADAAIAGPFGI